MSRIVAFHSYRRGVGKSGLAANLAVLLAQAGRRAAVVDADLAAPSQQALFGLEAAEPPGALNEALEGKSPLDQAVVDLTPRLGLTGAGRLLVVPARAGGVTRPAASALPTELNEALLALSQGGRADFWLVDTPAGLDEAAQQIYAVSDTLVVVVGHDQRDYQGIAVTLDVARQLEVPRLLLLLNQWPAMFDPAEARARLEAAYQCEVAGIIPFWDELAALGGSALFVVHHPDHPLTRALRQVAARLAE